jgi:Xaa-Pro aminopeptidase
MRTMHPVLKRGALYWDEELLPRACFAERFARLRALIAAQGDDAWLLYGDVERYGHVAYFSNFLPRARAALALVPRDGDPAILVAVGPRDVPAAKTLTWIEDVRPFSNLGRQLPALIHERGLAKARLGLAGIEESLSVGEWNDIASALPHAQWGLRSAAAMKLRQAKDRAEQAALRRSARAVAKALDLVPQIVRASMTTRALAAAVDRDLRMSAAEDVRVLIAAGEGARSLRPADDSVLQKGDQILLYAAAEVQRYWAEGARSFVLGSARDAQRALAARAAAALAAMRAAAVPGAGLGDLHAAAERHLDDAELRASARAYGYGHGIGLDPEEAPFVGPESDERLVEGASLALRVIAHAAGQGIALGQQLLVGATGNEALTDAPGLIECG